MKQKIFQIVCMALAALMLAGCGRQAEQREIQPTTERSRDIHMLRTEWSSTETGYYRLYNRTEDGVNLCYVDFTTGQNSFVCNQPACQHAEKSCNSYFKGRSHGILFSNMEHLYFLKYTDSSENPMKLYRMNLDGSDHKLIHTFRKDEFFFMNPAYPAFDGQYIYFIITSWDDETMHNIPKLLQINVDTGKTTALLICNQNIGTEEGQQPYIVEPHLVGAHERTLYLTVSYLKETSNLTGLAGSDEDAQNMLTSLLALDLNTGKIEVVDTWKNADRRYRVQDDQMYYVDFIEKALKVWHIKTGETHVISSNLKVRNADDTILRSIYDGKCIVDIFNPEQQRYFRYAVNLQTGEISALSLEYHEDDETYYVHIKLEMADSFIVIYDQKEEAHHVLHKDGTLEEVIESEPQYARIKKDDYWNNIPNYDPIAALEDAFSA